MSEIDKLTKIHPDAKIGKDVKIEAFTTIEDDVEIGDGCHIGPNVTIMSGARLGKNCRVFPGAVISAIPQDLKFKGEYSTVEIGDNTTIRECVTINRGTSDREKTVVGNNCLIMAYVHIAHDALIGNHVILVNCATLAGHVTIEDYAILEGLVAVQQFASIGQHAFVTGGSLVRKNVPPYVRAAREPLSYVGINSIGLKRRGFEEKKIRLIEDIYRKLYVTGNNIGDSLKEIEKEIPECEEKRTILDFIHNSEKGVIKRAIKK